MNERKWRGVVQFVCGVCSFSSFDRSTVEVHEATHPKDSKAKEPAKMPAPQPELPKEEAKT